MPFLTLLLQHKEFLVILILLATLGLSFVYIKDLHNKIETLKSDNAVLTSNLVASNASIKTLQSSIDQQNTAVEQLKSAADARVQSHAVEISAANAKAETYRQQALDILRLKPNTDKCASASALINSEVAKNAKK